jgi:peptidyl-prolyl cis-trans isomerase A (cyclophilin A)
MFAQTPAPAPNAALMHPASLKEQAPASFKVKLTTTKGDIIVQVTRSWAPKGADRFYNLVKNGFFTDASFFRYVPGFIVQFGIPADPKVAAVWQNGEHHRRPGHAGQRPGHAGLRHRRSEHAHHPVVHQPGGQYARPWPAGLCAVRESDLKGWTSCRSSTAATANRPIRASIQTQGKAYLDKNFPKLDSIKSATIVP